MLQTEAVSKNLRHCFISLFSAIFCLHSAVLSEAIGRTEFSSILTVSRCFLSGEIKSTVWTRQDSTGARGQDTHSERGQGLSCIYLNISACILVWSMKAYVFMTMFSSPGVGQVRVRAGCFPPADGGLQRSASSCWENCLSAEITTRGRGPYQGWNISSIHSKTQDSQVHCAYDKNYSLLLQWNWLRLLYPPLISSYSAMKMWNRCTNLLKHVQTCPYMEIRVCTI